MKGRVYMAAVYRATSKCPSVLCLFRASRNIVRLSTAKPKVMSAEWRVVSLSISRRQPVLSAHGTCWSSFLRFRKHLNRLRSLLKSFEGGQFLYSKRVTVQHHVTERNRINLLMI